MFLCFQIILCVIHHTKGLEHPTAYVSYYYYYYDPHWYWFVI